MSLEQEKNENLHTRNVPFNFKYTKPRGNFCWKERNFYEDNGYIIKKNLVSPALLDECRDRCNKLWKFGAVKGWTVVKKGEQRSDWISMEDILWDPVFSKVALHPMLLDMVENFTGSDIVATESMICNIPSTMQERIPFKQETCKMHINPDNNLVCTITMMDNISEDVLEIIPGSHKFKKLKSPYSFVKPDLRQGDTVFLHPLTYKNLFINNSKLHKNKKFISTVYASCNCYYIDQDKKEMFADIQKQTIPFVLEFEDFWKLKFRLARGRITNLISRY